MLNVMEMCRMVFDGCLFVLFDGFIVLLGWGNVFMVWSVVSENRMRSSMRGECVKYRDGDGDEDDVDVWMLRYFVLMGILVVLDRLGMVR